METNEITVKVTLRFDGKWSRHLTAEELVDYVKTRMNSSLGFRGAITKFKVVPSRSNRE